MKLSARTSGIVADGVHGRDVHDREVHDRARAMRDAGADITVLTIGDHDQTTPKSLIAALAVAARAGHTGSVPMALVVEDKRLEAALRRIAAFSGEKAYWMSELTRQSPTFPGLTRDLLPRPNEGPGSSPEQPSFCFANRWR